MLISQSRLSVLPVHSSVVTCDGWLEKTRKKLCTTAKRGNYQRALEQSLRRSPFAGRKATAATLSLARSLALDLTSFSSYSLKKENTKPTQAARVIANLVVAAGGVLIRAGVQAYRQAIVSESSLFFSPLTFFSTLDFHSFSRSLSLFSLSPSTFPTLLQTRQSRATQVDPPPPRPSPPRR